MGSRPVPTASVKAGLQPRMLDGTLAKGEPNGQAEARRAAGT